VEGKLRVGSISSITTLWMPEVVHYFKENYPKVKIEILDGNYDEIREWIIRGQVDCGFLSSIVADDLKFYPLRDRVPSGGARHLPVPRECPYCWFFRRF